MSQPVNDRDDPGGDRLLLGMRVDRVTRADGRYLLYYAWPPGTDGNLGDQPEPDPPTEGSDV